jgi:serine/threonine-protein kinase RsbW
MPSFTFPARFEILDDIREFVADVARENDFNEKEIYSLQLAVDEAASNIIEHAYEGILDATFEVSCAMEDNELVITMLDHGTPFDISSIKDPDIKADLSERQIGGLGIYLMRKLMDEVRYQSTRTGNLLTMIKRK